MLAEENRVLRADNATLSGELEQMNRVASYVGSRVARVLAGARRANNYNAALVGELKRWNRKLEARGYPAWGILGRPCACALCVARHAGARARAPAHAGGALPSCLRVVCWPGSGRASAGNVAVLKAWWVLPRCCAAVAADLPSTAGSLGWVYSRAELTWCRA